MRKYFRSKIIFLCFCYFPLGVLVPARAVLATNSNHIIAPWSVGQTVTLLTKTFSNGTEINSETDIYSIVGQDYIDGKNYLWFEMEKDKSSGVKILQKLLILRPDEIPFEFFLNDDFSVLKPKRLIQQIILGNDKKFNSTNEFEIPSDSVSVSSSKPISRYEYSVTESQEIQVVAGNFSASNFNLKTQKSSNVLSKQVWWSKDVPVLGLVKEVKSIAGPDNARIQEETELISYKETGAFTKINSRPRFISLAQQRLKSKPSNSFQVGNP